MSSCSRSSEPSLRWKRRTQPTWSEGAPRSIALVGDGRVPAVVAVEVAQHRPDPVDRRVDDGALHDLRHRPQPPKARFRASKPPWNTPPPMSSTSSASRSGGAVELGRPFGEGAVAVGDRRQPQGRDVVRRAASAIRGSSRCRTCRSRRGRAASRGCGRRCAGGSRARSRSCRPARRSRCGSRAIAGCQFGRPLKSRTRAQTARRRALMTLEV